MTGRSIATRTRTGTARRWRRSWSDGRASSASRVWRRERRCCRWPSRWPERPTLPADDRLAFAIRWAADHGAKIISMSLGGVRRPARNPTACPDDEQQAIYHALRKGAVVLAAGGNRGDQDNAVEEPGVCLGVVSVGAINSTGAVAPFSSRQHYLTLTAPGVEDRIDRSRRFAVLRGRARARPRRIASAAAALVWSKYPQLTGSQLVGRLLATPTSAATGTTRPTGTARSTPTARSPRRSRPIRPTRSMPQPGRSC